MAQPYVGEIRIFAGNFAPLGWQLCEGQLLSISEHETLFNLIGTTYGGDGQSTFAVPDMRGRLPLHQGNGFILAETGGAEEITLAVSQIPNHNHAVRAATTGQVAGPAGAVLATASSTQPGVRVYSSLAANQTFDPATIQPAGGSQPHTNLQPYLCLNFIISLFGIFPSPT